MAVISNKSFLGIGWDFPVGPAAGQTEMAQYEDDVREAILIILLTNRESASCGLHLERD